MRRIGLFVLATALMSTTTAAQDKPSSRADDAGAVVTALYRQVVIRHPIGIPSGADETVFAPYLSDALRRRLALRAACDADWSRQNPDPHLKPAGPFEDGLFTGTDERYAPKSFRLERVALQRDGSYLAYVRLTLPYPPPNKPDVWEVIAVVTPAASHPTIDDVLFLGRGRRTANSSLSAALAAGCDGSRWIGR